MPLLPRKTPPPPPSSDERAGGGGAGGKKKDRGAAEENVPQPPLEDTAGLELDQQLVVHSYNTAITTIHGMVRGWALFRNCMTHSHLLCPQMYPLVQTLESNIETTAATLRPPTQVTSQPAEGGLVEEEKKAGGKGGKGGKDKGGKVCQKNTYRVHTARAIH